MRVICTAMLEVEPAYFLREVREFHTWERVRADLEDGEVLRRNRHYEVLFSPYRRTPTRAWSHGHHHRVAGEQVVRQARATGRSSWRPRSRSPPTSST